MFTLSDIWECLVLEPMSHGHVVYRVVALSCRPKQFIAHDGDTLRRIGYRPWAHKLEQDTL